MERVISHGLAASERYLKLRIPLPDRPGQLARVAELIVGGRTPTSSRCCTRGTASGMQISDVELELHIETRGPEHAEQVLDKLRDGRVRPARRLLTPITHRVGAVAYGSLQGNCSRLNADRPTSEE